MSAWWWCCLCRYYCAVIKAWPTTQTGRYWRISDIGLAYWRWRRTSRFCSVRWMWKDSSMNHTTRELRNFFTSFHLLQKLLSQQPRVGLVFVFPWHRSASVCIYNEFVTTREPAQACGDCTTVCIIQQLLHTLCLMSLAAAFCQLSSARHTAPWTHHIRLSVLLDTCSDGLETPCGPLWPGIRQWHFKTATEDSLPFFRVLLSVVLQQFSRYTYLLTYYSVY